MTEIKRSLREYLPEELPFQSEEIQAHLDEQILTNLLSRAVDCGFLCYKIPDEKSSVYSPKRVSFAW